MGCEIQIEGRVKMRGLRKIKEARWRSSSLGCLLLFPHKKALSLSYPCPADHRHVLLYMQGTVASQGQLLFFEVCRSATLNGSWDSHPCFHSANVAASKKSLFSHWLITCICSYDKISMSENTYHLSKHNCNVFGLGKGTGSRCGISEI